MKLLITERALADLAEIEAYSIGEWGKQAASKCIGEFEAALVRLQERPALLQPEPELHPKLCFYRVGKHLLVCGRQPRAIFLLTVIHASRDVPSRLAEMQVTLAGELKLLHRQLQPGKKRRN